MPQRRTDDAGFKARVVLEGARTVSELAAKYGVHPPVPNQGKGALPGGT